MKTRLTSLLLLLLSLSGARAQDVYNQIDEMGNITQRRENQNFNKHNNDTTRNKEVPKGLYVWTIDRKFGDMIPAQPDTLSHLFMNSVFNTGIYGEYNTTGSNLHLAPEPYLHQSSRYRQLHLHPALQFRGETA